MRIICPRCNAAYTLPEDKIPERRAVGRCKRCGAEIVFNPGATPSTGPGFEGLGTSSPAQQAPEGIGSGIPSPAADFGPGAPAGTPSGPPHGFSIGEALKCGWNSARKRLGFFFFFLLLAILIPRIPGVLQGALRESNPIASAVLYLLSMGLHLLTAMGLLKVSLNLHDGKPCGFADLFSCAPSFLDYFYASILYGLMVTVGYLLLLLPGLYLTYRYIFYAFAVVEEGAGPLQALKKSAAMTKGSIWKLILFSLVLLAINILGAIFLLIGLIWTVPTSLAASAHVYRTLSGETHCS